MLKKLSPTLQDLPLKIAGSSVFGQYPKISTELTFNMYISDGWLVPFPGYKKISHLGTRQGRGVFNSTRFNHLISVSDNGVFITDTNNSTTQVATIDTFVGDVTIVENNVHQIGICDQSNIYVFNYNANTFQKISIDFIPTYIASQNGRFLASVQDQPLWRLTPVGNGTSFPDDAQHVGAFQTKPDVPIALIPIPSRGNNLLILGSVLGEVWTDVGAQLFPYQKNTAFNIDYGASNSSTVGFNDKLISWISVNEKSSASVMVSQGGDPQIISTDGIARRLSLLTNPSNSYGFAFRIDDHNFYQFTFPDDNLSLVYDFKTGGFYNMTDENMNYHIAKRMTFFNNSNYFQSFRDGEIYQMSPTFTDYNGNEIPRIRVTPNIRCADSSPFVAQEMVFTVEQGNANTEQRIDASLSYDGGNAFGNYVSRILNNNGNRKNILNWFNLGRTNDMVAQFRFFSHDKFLVTDGVMRVFQ